MQRFLVALTGLSLSFALYAADKPKSPEKPMPNLTKEQRESMAKIHDQMAACLRSDKTLDACHEEMKLACKDNDACPMMMKGHHGGMHKD